MDRVDGRKLEIVAPIAVLLTVLRAAAPIMKLKANLG